MNLSQVHRQLRQYFASYVISMSSGKEHQAEDALSNLARIVFDEERLETVYDEGVLTLLQRDPPFDQTNAYDRLGCQVIASGAKCNRPKPYTTLCFA